MRHEDDESRTATHPAPRSDDASQPLLAGFTDLRLLAVVLAVLVLLVAGVSSVAGRTTSELPAAGGGASDTGSLADVSELDLRGGDATREVRAEIERWLEAGDPTPPFAVPEAVSEAQIERVSDFYRLRSAAPAWTGADGRPAEVFRELLGSLEGDPSARDLTAGLEKIAERLPAGRAAERAELDRAVTYLFFEHAERLMAGRVAATAIGKTWETEPRDLDLVVLLENALSTRAVAEVLAGLAPPHDGYAELVEAHHHYLELAADGGWPMVPDGPAVEEGEAMEAERYRALIDRLYTEGFLSQAAAESRLARLERHRSAAAALENEPASEESDTAQDADTVQDASNAQNASAQNADDWKPSLDRGLTAAVRSFQEANGLAIDGILGPNTIATLNVTAEERVEQIALNMERWRWLPADLGTNHVRVNIPAYELEAVRNGRVELTMAVVVGLESWPTPVMSELMERVVVNPYWHVPHSIVEDEIVAKAQKNPDYLRNAGFEVLENGEKVPLASVEPAKLDDPGVRVRQTPGETNALGQIKFLFPNRHNVYLHDTPHQAAFESHARDRSHGCVRVARPFDLADFVTRVDNNLEPGEVREELGERRPESLTLARELPVHLLYFTAFVDESGRVNFRDDIYGYDAAHRQALVADGWEGTFNPRPAASPTAAAD